MRRDLIAQGESLKHRGLSRFHARPCTRLHGSPRALRPPLPRDRGPLLLVLRRRHVREGGRPPRICKRRANLRTGMLTLVR